MTETDTDSPAATSPGTTERVSGRDAMGDRLAQLVECARRELAILAPQLDPHWFNQSRVGTALARFLTTHPQNRARLLVEDAEQAVRDNDRVVSIARRLSDFLEIRRLGEQDLGCREMFALADRVGVFHQGDTTRLEALFSANDVRAAATLKQRFNEAWERSEPVTELRTAGL
jgi:hypothetical protein